MRELLIPKIDKKEGVIYMPKKYRIAIITLSVLFAVSALSLTATLIYNAVRSTEPATVVVPNNLITPDPKNDSEASVGTGNTDDSANHADDVTGGKTPSADAVNAAVDTDEGAAVLSANETDANVEAAAANTVEQDLTYADVFYLHNKNTGDNIPFAVTNMFPGDTETKYYCVNVRYNDDVTVRFRADVREGYEKLAEVLRCRVVLLTTDEVLYDGLMRDMPTSLDHLLETDSETESELYYRIDAYLETSVGNDYQMKELVADFRWWVEETDSLIPPKTGDVSMLPYAAAASVSLFFLVLLLKKKKKEDADNA